MKYIDKTNAASKLILLSPESFPQAIKNGDVVSDFRGVGLGDSWISPMDSVNTWGMFLYQMVSGVTCKVLMNILAT